MDGVRRRLAHHELWQAVLFFLPPLFAFYYAIFFLHRFEWLDPDSVLIAGASLPVVASAFAVARFRLLAPSERFVARQLDDKAKAEDRFVTLATIDAFASSPDLLSRLKAEAAPLYARIDFKRDFPFRVSRSFLNSCIASLIAIVLFHLSVELAPLFRSGSSGDRDLALVTEELARFPGLEKLAERLKTAASRIQDPAISDEDKRSSIEELKREIDRQLAGSEWTVSDKREELLNQAKSRLSGFEQGLGSGQGRGKGAGGSQSSEQREGGGKGSADGDTAEKQGDKDSRTAAGAEGEKISEATRTTGQREKLAGEIGGKEKKEDDHLRPDKGNGSGRGPKEKMEFKGGMGPQEGKSPDLQRLTRPGDQGPSAKNSRFVTVQLPEEFTPSRSGGMSDATRTASASKPAVGNLPLARPERSDAAAEKQMLPLEYRGMIR